MAVKINFNKAAVDKTLIDSQPHINNLQTYIKSQQCEQNIIDIIKELKKKEEEFYNLFGVDTLEALQEKLNKCRDNVAVIGQLSGPILNRIIVPAENELDIKEANLQEEFSTYMKNELENEKALNLTGVDLANFVNKVLNEYNKTPTKSNNKGDTRYTVSSTKAFTAGGSRKINEVFLKELTPAQRRYAENFIRKKKLKGNISQSVAKNTISTSINWSSITKQKTSKTVNKEEIEGIKLALIGYLTESLNLDLDVLDNDWLVYTIEEVFEKKASTFLIGKNIRDGITGILGEIQGLYIFRYLLGKGMLSNAVKWTGGIQNQFGKDPHNDLQIIVNNSKFNIQIKNTTEDATKDDFNKEIGFANRSVDSFFKYTEIASEDQQALAQIYQMFAFNVEYQKDETSGVYSEASNKVFQGSRDQIELLKQRADQILSMFADVLLYMASGRSMKKLGDEGNVIYLVGGARLYSASQMLTKIFSELKNAEKTYFQITPYYKSGDPTIKNIVGYLNKKQIVPKEQRTDAIGTLYLKSSYLFD